MFDHPSATAFALTGARVVLPEAVVDAAVHVADGRIAAIGPDRAMGPARDLRGAVLIPGIVDLHTDHVERHTHPRAGVLWPPLPALLAYDAVVISGGTTTVFDSLSVGAAMQKPERRDLLLPLVAAIAAAQAEGLFRADHRLHLRCEISDPATIALVDRTIDHPLTGLLSVMDHTPGDRQSPNIESWFWHMLRDMEIDEAEGRERMAELLDRSHRHGPVVRAHCVRAARGLGVALMSHDDRSHDHVEAAVAEGCAISEFPTTLAAARHARAHGMAIVAGAPNYLRGGSQSGNVSVAALLAEGLVDALASDYIPRSPLDAAFAIAADPALPLDLPAALRLVTRAPATMTGLGDRGEIAVGRRADLVAVRLSGDQPVVEAVWRDGRQVY